MDAFGFFRYKYSLFRKGLAKSTNGSVERIVVFFYKNDADIAVISYFYCWFLQLK